MTSPSKILAPLQYGADAPAVVNDNAAITEGIIATTLSTAVSTDVALTVAQFKSAARYAFTANGVGAGWTLTVPSEWSASVPAERGFWVANATGQTVTVTTSTPASPAVTVDVPDGEVALLHSDGTDVTALVRDTTAAIAGTAFGLGLLELIDDAALRAAAGQPSSGQTDNALARMDGAEGKIQGSPVVVDDSGNIDDILSAKIVRDGVSAQYIQIGPNTGNGNYISSRSLESLKKVLRFQNFHDGSGSASGSLDFVWHNGPASSPVERMRLTEAGVLDVPGSITTDTIDDSGDGKITANTPMVLAEGRRYDTSIVIGDDAAAEIVGVGAGFLRVRDANNAERVASFYYDSGGSPYVPTVLANNITVATAATAPTGTTHADGGVYIDAVTSDGVWIENRSGGSITFYYILDRMS